MGTLTYGGLIYLSAIAPTFPDFGWAILAPLLPMAYFVTGSILLCNCMTVLSQEKELGVA
eukprot:CAMPEP_0194433556 /NCGR_PEP_ID=MMETSP0176-20130528/77398_1 /TAXON_ID=216777 /ORGANISM="Proboscia alata, Strain PI-D3" /LENGTH=59 /DNA_ID=CAMNT_0039250877 /DNA_START=37 /DNA_END=212 /DNA_ORIENTATION=+